MGKNTKTNWDILDQILSESHIPARGKEFGKLEEIVEDPNNPGRYITQQEFDQLYKNVDNIERRLRG